MSVGLCANREPVAFETTKTMKNIRLADVLVLLILSAGLLPAGDVVETNAMPAQIQNLMETQGYAMKPPAFNASLQNTNSQRNIPLAEGTRFNPLELPKPKAGWSPWDNTNIRHVGRTDASMNPFSPPFAQYEYDITYSFSF